MRLPRLASATMEPGERRVTRAATAAEASTRCQLTDFGERVTNAIIERREESGRNELGKGILGAGGCGH